MTRNRWLFVVILIALVAAGVVAWLQRGTAGGTSASGSATSSAAGGACELTEVPNTAADKDIWNGTARVRQGILVAGTQYTGSLSNGISGEGSSKGWTVRPIRVWGQTSSSLEDVSSDGAGGAWAVGVLIRSPAISRWNGATWTLAPVADPGPGLDALSGVAALTPRLAWAVGRHEVGDAYRTLIERWDGATWDRVESPNVGTAPNALKDVAITAPDDAWAVGWHVAGRSYRPLVEHWNGARWSVVPTPDLGSGDGILSGVSARAANDVWAGGWVARAGVPSPVVERWNGSRWTRAPLPADLGPAAITDVTTTTDGVALVGRRIIDQVPQPLAIVLDRTGWHEAPLTAAPSSQASLSSVTTGASGVMWAVGTRLGSTGSFGSLVVSGCAPA
jgi:hypothetical protein